MDIVFAVHYFNTLERIDAGRHIRERVCSHICAMSRNVSERDTHHLSLEEASSLKRGLAAVKKYAIGYLQRWKQSTDVEAVQTVIDRLNQTIRSERAEERAQGRTVTDQYGDERPASAFDGCPNMRHALEARCHGCDRCSCLVGPLSGGQLCGGCL